MSRRTLALSAAAVLVVAAALFGRNPHPHAWWESIPAYGALFGYAGAWAIVVLAKSILTPLLHRDDHQAAGEGR